MSSILHTAHGLARLFYGIWPQHSQFQDQTNGAVLQEVMATSTNMSVWLQLILFAKLAQAILHPHLQVLRQIHPR